MAEYTTIKLNPESHLLLDQPLLRLPYELSRNNFKVAQRHIDLTTKQVTDGITNGAKSASSAADPQQAALSTIDAALTRLNNLKRKLSALNDDTQILNNQARARLAHLEQLHEIPNLADVKYEEWSRVRLDRLLVDYLLRNGYVDSARELAEKKGITELVDLEEFENVRKIQRSLYEGRKVDAALAWCTENKQNLKKMNSTLEFELRLQQFIELARQQDSSKLVEAVMHARKHLVTSSDSDFVTKAAGMLPYGPDTLVEPYRSLYSPSRWSHLAKVFVETHHNLYSLPQRPLLDIALSAGLSALKTPACHSRFISPSSGLNAVATNGSTSDARDVAPQSPAHSQVTDASKTSTVAVPSLTSSVCPICSTELNKLARNVPYAHHSKSHVENDPVVLPNGRIYGRERLIKLNEKLGSQDDKIRDPMDPTGEAYDKESLRKVFIS